jgi:hypothetical protein
MLDDGDDDEILSICAIRFGKTTIKEWENKERKAGNFYVQNATRDDFAFIN